MRIAAALVLALVLAGCGGGGEKEPAATSHLPPGCDVPAVERAVRGYLAAISAGDRAAIDRRLSPAADFVRLTAIGPDGRRFSTADRAKALAYLAARNESLRLIRLLVARGVDANHVTVTGALTRAVQDAGRDVAVYDGAVNCVHGTVTRWRLRPSG